MLHNLDRPKQAQEFTFLRRTNKIIYSSSCFSNATVKRKHTQKHFSPQLDSKLSFNEHTNIMKATKKL